VVGREFKDSLLPATYRVQSFADLEQWFHDLLNRLEQVNQESWRTHHIATLRKIRNRLINIAQRCAGLVTQEADASDLPWGSFADRTLYVIDVANLEEDAQDLIFARVVSQLRMHLERRTLGVKHVVVFVDELNRYAPNDGPDTYVRKMLLDLAERGRYLGLVLFGAQQFRSQVHRRVVGNAGTALFGRMDADELASPGYAVLSPAIRTKLATLEKGHLMVRHPHFTQPVFVRFPRPPVLSGREGVERFPAAAEVPLHVAVTRSLRRLDPTITAEWVKGLTELYEPHEILEARSRAEGARPPNVRAFIEAHLRRIVPTRPAGKPELLVPIRGLPTANPYGI
jgi:hypothetical protein